MKKLVSIVLVLVLTLSCFAGCGGGNDGEFDSSASIGVISREDGSGTRGAFVELFGIEEKNQEETLEQDPEDPKLSQENEPEESLDEDKEVQYVSITIESGDVAKTVSEKLYEAGLIESAVEYSNFLSGNNYSYRLRAGYYEIPVGSDHHQIAEILCKIAEE